MAWDCGARSFFVRIWSRHLVQSIFPFPLTTARRIGKWKNNRQCATICINIGGSLHPAPVDNAPRTKVSFRRFFYVRSACPICASSIAALIDWRSINGKKSPVAHCLLFFTLPILWAVLAGNRNWFISRWQPNENAKEHPAPQSQAIIYHLSFSRPPLLLAGHSV